MNKLPIILLAVAMMANIEIEKVSTLSGVCLTAGVMISQDNPVEEKYKRKDCPVCEGKGWYISGDDIQKVDCGYCEPENSTTEKPEEETEDCCETEVIRE